MKVVAYVRVSTEKQAEEGLGLEVQEASIRQWAKANGHSVVAMCCDAGVSGATDLDQRDGLADALERLRARSAQAVVVHRLDRLARDLVVQEQLLAEVWRLGGEVFSTASGEAHLRDDPDDPSRRMIRQILGAVSEYERAMITLRLRRGRAAKAARGGYAYGSPPFGTQARDRALVAQPDEAATVDRMRALRSEGLSLREIAAVMGREGRTSKRGGGWHPETVARVLARAAA